MKGRHYTIKKSNDSTFNKEWSGVSYAPHCKYCTCNVCGERLHIEGHDTHYCPRCDNFRPHNDPRCIHK